MTNLTREVLERFEVRKSKKEKGAFRAWLCEELEKLGYEAKVEPCGKGWGKSHNVVVGDPDTAKVLFTAHYDTCAVLPFPNFITPRNFFWYLVYQIGITLGFFAMVFVVTFLTSFGLMALTENGLLATAVGSVVGYAVLIFDLWWMMDGKANRHTANDNTSGVMTLLEIAQALSEEERQEVCLVFFDNEEKGLLGSNGFLKKHKALRKTALVINFDCVSDGDSLQFFPGKKIKKTDTVQLLRDSFLPTAEKSVEVVTGFGFYPSDQAAFQRGVGVCALKKSKLFGWYMDRIHTAKDTVLMEENVDLLRAGAVRLVRNLREEKISHAE